MSHPGRAHRRPAPAPLQDPSGSFAFSEESLLAREFVQVYPPARPEHGQLYPPATHLASGADHVVVLAEDEGGAHTVFTCGSGDQGQLGRVPPNKCSRDGNFRLAAASAPSAEFLEKLQGRRTSLAAVQTLLKFHPVSSRKLWGSKRLTGVFAGGWSTAVVDEAGRVFAWGLNNYGQLGQPSSSKRTIEYAPKRSKLFAEQIESLAFGQHHALALTAANKVMAVGRGDTGQLGVLENGAPKAEASAPCFVDALAGQTVTKIGAGGTCSFAIADDGRGFSWGFGENLQLAADNEDDRAEPETIDGQQIAGKPEAQIPARGLVQIDAGGQHTVAIGIPR